MKALSLQIFVLVMGVSLSSAAVAETISISETDSYIKNRLQEVDLDYERNGTEISTHAQFNPTSFIHKFDLKHVHFDLRKGLDSNFNESQVVKVFCRPAYPNCVDWRDGLQQSKDLNIEYSGNGYTLLKAFKHLQELYGLDTEPSKDIFN